MEEQFVYEAKDGMLNLKFSQEFLQKEFLREYFDDGVYVKEPEKMLKVMKESLTRGTVREKVEELLEALLREVYYDDAAGVEEIPEEDEELKIKLYSTIMLEEPKEK